MGSTPCGTLQSDVRLLFYFLPNGTKQTITLAIHPSSFGHADRSISMILMNLLLIYEMESFGSTSRTPCAWYSGGSGEGQTTSHRIRLQAMAKTFHGDHQKAQHVHSSHRDADHIPTLHLSTAAIVPRGKATGGRLPGSGITCVIRLHFQAEFQQALSQMQKCFNHCRCTW